MHYCLAESDIHDQVRSFRSGQVARAGLDAGSTFTLFVIAGLFFRGGIRSQSFLHRRPYPISVVTLVA
ncbi:hypothetical protein DEJ00_00670 [Curtobacterium sp. MCLR17_039]|nr:hypothetical protein DEJ00_00670 [Curtobacterium sp. MCLR17_039]